MTILGKIRRAFRTTYEKYEQKKLLETALHKVNGITANCGRDIPELTDIQKKEIDAYWVQYGIKTPYNWHKLYYGLTGNEDVRFVPDRVFHREIKRVLNNNTFGHVWSDKCYMDFFLRDTKCVQSVIRNVNGRFLDENFRVITLEEAQRIADSYDALVVKPSIDTATGEGVALLQKPIDVAAVFREYKKNFVLQIPLKQHSQMAGLNSSSINTIRVNSVLFDGDAHVMTAFVKVGEPGKFADNQGHNRYFIGLNPNGTFRDYAIDHDLHIVHELPSGFAFAGKPVPGYDKLCAAIEKAHMTLPHFGFAFWDVCINEDGEPVVVEVNLKHPNTPIPQVATGRPFFGEYTDRILAYSRDRKQGK